MITIGIELNDVIRNIKKQILKYYQRDFDNSLDLDNIDDKEDVLNKYVKFESQKDLKDFLYIDYPYEIFGCAKTIDKDLVSEMAKWLYNLTNYEDDEIRVSFYSLNEESLTIQSTFFFLSKIGTRVREVIFPVSIDELKGKFDVTITANNDVIDKLNNFTKIVKINREWNNDKESFLTYDSIIDIMGDDKFIDKIVKKS